MTRLPTVAEADVRLDSARQKEFTGVRSRAASFPAQRRRS
jgi:hypothetical protein